MKRIAVVFAVLGLLGAAAPAAAPAAGGGSGTGGDACVLPDLPKLPVHIPFRHLCA